MLNAIDELTCECIAIFLNRRLVGCRYHGLFVRQAQLGAQNRWRLFVMSAHFADHGLPLVQLKERRRDLVIALRNRKTPPSKHELMEIAWVQQAISAAEEVISDLDSEIETDARATKELPRPAYFGLQAISCR